MFHRRVTHLLLPALALAAFACVAVPVRARADINGRLTVSLGSYPHWTTINGTQVDELPMAERPNYDVFRYGGTYYAYDDGRWYSSTNPSGDYTVMEDNTIPVQFQRIPREHWRTYPSTWSGGVSGTLNTGSGSLHVAFGTQPTWTMVGGTQVYEVPMTDRPDYDVFREGNTYYAYDNDRWYQSSTPEGDYTVIDEGQVPADFQRIPRNHWRHYATWRNRGDRDRDQDRMANATSNYDNGSTSLQINWNGSPHWRTVRGTHVMETRPEDRPDYDVFRVRGNYYAYANGRWYSAHHHNGQFVTIDDSAVPSDLQMVPRDHWRNYPNGWTDRSMERHRHRERDRDNDNH